MVAFVDLMNEYPGKIVVDCDTNEIFGDSYFEPYELPRNTQNDNFGKEQCLMMK